MIVRGSTAASFPVLFASGPPDADVQWELTGPTGSLGGDSLPVPAGAVSISIKTDAADNTLRVGELFSYRDLSWTYTVGGVVINGETRYTIEARLPLGVSTDGVRRKLGVDAVDLPDGDISLVKAYLKFQKATSPEALAASLNSFVVIDAIEAQAALDVLPTMTVRVAAQEESGTDKYKRQTVDWNAIALGLSDMIGTGVAELNPLYDPTLNFGSLLILAGPSSDAYTGA